MDFGYYKAIIMKITHVLGGGGDSNQWSPPISGTFMPNIVANSNVIHLGMIFIAQTL